MKKLAIIIPYFKIDFFEKTLLSLFNQTNLNFNIYIGNDNSPDDPSQLIEKYSKNLNIKYFKFEENLGHKSLVQQWQRCFKKIYDEYWVMLLGDDDVLERNLVAKFYENSDEILKYEVVRFPSQIINSRDEIISITHFHPHIEGSIDFILKKIKGRTRSSLSEYIFSVNAVKKNGFKDFPLAWHSDDLAILEFSNFGKILTINGTKVFIRSSDVNISGRKDLAHLKNQASFEYYNYLLNKKKFEINTINRNLISSKLEKSVLNNKKNLKLLFFLSKQYLSKFKIKRLILFVYKYIYEILNASRRKSREK